ncbi:F-box only protein 44-like [Convolutriloba macropyga]|uniref:F-box only protein 44-like n=1 Tax=Convolutriloba macropyga TaxID=536237 RepID=UPI003F5209FF
MTSMSVFDIVPEDVLDAIFLRTPALDLVLNCPLVCRRWFEALSGRYFWLQKIESEGMRISERNRQLLLDNSDYSLCIYILKGVACGLLPFNRNLIRNPCGEDGRKYWVQKEAHKRHADYDSDSDEDEDYDDQYSAVRFEVEEKPVGAYPIPDKVGVPTQHCFVTSYRLGIRVQVLNFSKYSIREGVMELLKPTINYSQWVSSRHDCGCEAELSIQVKSGLWTMKPDPLDWNTSQEGVERRVWYKMEDEVQCALPIDTIVYRSTGKDRQFWAGNYGSKTTACSLILKI